MSKKINGFIDLEFVVSHGKQAILSIGLVIVNDDYQVEETFYQLITPKQTPKKGYKGIPMSEWKKAVSYPEALRRLKEVLNRYDGLNVGCYGGADEKIFDKTCSSYQQKNPLEGRFHDLMPEITNALGLKQPITLTKVLRRLGRTNQRQLHHALVDAYDLMLIMEAITKGEPIRENPLQAKVRSEMSLTTREAKVLSENQEGTFYYDREEGYRISASCEAWCIYTAEGIKTFTGESSSVCPASLVEGWNPQAVQYEAILEKESRGPIRVRYLKDGEIILNGWAAVLPSKDVSFSFDKITEAGRELLDLGLVQCHVYERYTTTKHLFFKHRLRSGKDYYFSITQSFTRTPPKLTQNPRRVTGVGVISVHETETDIQLFLVNADEKLETIQQVKTYRFLRTWDKLEIDRQVKELKEELVHQTSVDYCTLNLIGLDDWLKRYEIPPISETKGVKLKSLSGFIQATRKRQPFIMKECEDNIQQQERKEEEKNKERNDFEIATDLMRAIGIPAAEQQEILIGVSTLRYSKGIISSENVKDIFQDGIIYQIRPLIYEERETKEKLI